MRSGIQEKIYFPKANIRVPPLISDGKTVIPGFRLSKVGYCVDDKGRNFGIVEYHEERRLPTLKQLRHTYYDRENGSVMEWHNENGIWIPDHVDWASAAYRSSVFPGQDKGEYTATFAQPRRRKKGESVPEGYRPVKIIERP